MEMWSLRFSINRLLWTKCSYSLHTQGGWHQTSLSTETKNTRIVSRGVSQKQHSLGVRSEQWAEQSCALCVCGQLCVCVYCRLLWMFVDSGKENEYHSMLTDDWKELIPTAENCPWWIHVPLLNIVTSVLITVNTYEIIKSDGDKSLEHKAEMRPWKWYMSAIFHNGWYISFHKAGIITQYQGGASDWSFFKAINISQPPIIKYIQVEEVVSLQGFEWPDDLTHTHSAAQCVPSFQSPFKLPNSMRCTSMMFLEKKVLLLGPFNQTMI